MGTVHAAAAAVASPTPQGHDVRFAWGGELRQVFSRTIDTGTQLEHHTWSVGDGCVIRHRVTVDGQASGDWEIQDVPADVSQSLLDIYFLEDGVTGWACGTAGLFLSTTDGGDTWAADRLCVDACWDQSAIDTYPTLWRVRFLDEDEGYLCGLWTFLRTTDGGATWDEVGLSDGGTGSYNPDHFEFYALEIVQLGGEWIGVCAGQQWSWSGHCPPSLATEGGGFAFYVNSTSGDGTIWTKTFSEEEYNAQVPTPDPLLTINDPWDVAFAPNPQSLTGAVGYLCGGTGTDCGTILRTEDGGQTWSFEWGGGDCPSTGGPNDPATMYGIEALERGRAIAAGYAGHVMYRRKNPNNPDLFQWKKVWIDEDEQSPDPELGPLTGPLAGVGLERRDYDDEGELPDDADYCLFVGSWGVIASTVVPPIESSALPVWTSENEIASQEFGAQGKEHLYRFNDIYFRGDEQSGLAVGQHQGIAQSLDGGATWDSLYGGPGSSLNGDPNLEGLAFKDDGNTGVAVGSCATDGYSYKITFDTGTSTWNAPTQVTMPDSDWRLLGVDYAEFNHFWAAGWEFQGSVARPLIVRSTNNGTSWTAFDLTTVDPDTLPDGPPPDGLRFQDIAMLSARHGFAVGYIPGDETVGDPDAPMIYKIAYDDVLAEYTFSDVTPYGLLPNPVDARFHDVAVRGPNPQNGETYVAGGPNLLLVWDDSQGEFVNVSGIPGCPESCESLGNPTTCSLDFRSVSLAPSGSLILAGIEGMAHEHVSHELGRMLRKVNSTSSWEWIPGHTVKDCQATYAVSDSRAWMIASPDNRSSIAIEIEAGLWARPDVDPEWGQGTDSAVLIYETEP